MVHTASNAYLPARINMTSGEVIVMNFDPTPHTMTADGGSFDVEAPAAPPDNFTEVRFAGPAPGTYGFHCRYHPEMRGTLTVLGAVATPPPATRDAPVWGTALGLAALAGVALVRRRA